jgi:hypothetical protein
LFQLLQAFAFTREQADRHAPHRSREMIRQDGQSGFAF